jgi:2-polyprenyl-6-methoxyphenol hydroxylase-like FAD-dependent oxidoreductase
LIAPDAQVLIIGGGIGGLAAAAVLRRVGIPAAVYERAPEIREVGAGLSLWSNAIKALRQLGLEDAVVARGAPIEEAVTRTDRGVVLSQVSIADISKKAGAPTICIHRAELQQVLASAVEPEQIRLNATCVGIDLDSDGITARFADGRTARGSILVGADGIRSAVRDSLFGAKPPRYAGYFGYRGIAHGDFPELPMGRTEFALGRGAQVGLVHCGPKRVYWFATVNAPAGTPTPDPVGLKAEAMKRFAGWYSPIPAVIAATEPCALIKGDIVDRPPTWPWGRGRATLLGDAIHPTTPNMGQGACQAIEDAIVLADCLRRRGLSEAGLREYEETRRERTALVTRRSWSFGKVFQMENRVAVAVRNCLVRRGFGEERGKRLFEELLAYEPPVLDETKASGAQ